ILVSYISSISLVLSSINSFVHRNFTFHLVVLPLIYLLSTYFFFSYSVINISHQLFCAILPMNTIMILLFYSSPNNPILQLVHPYIHSYLCINRVLLIAL